MQVGETVHKTLTDIVSGSANTPRPKFTGWVVWVHPKGRFSLAEFQLPGGIIRECFKEIGP